MENNITPYTNYLCLEPVEKKQILIAETGNLQTFGKVIAIGNQVVDTKIGEYVAFELWDLKDFTIDDKKYYFVAEDQAVCKFTLSQ